MKRFRSALQDLGKVLMMPISVIAAAGLFLGLAAALQNPAIMGADFIKMEGVQLILGFIRKVAGALFGNLPILFAVAAGLGLAREEKPTAAFAAVIGFISMHVGINYTLTVQGLTPQTVAVDALIKQGMDKTQAMMYAAEFTNVLGIFSYNMSVLGGVLAGLLTVFLHNRFHKIVLPTAINFFGGRRFVPIITVVVLPLFGVVLALVWPYIGTAIAAIGRSISGAGAAGTFLYAFSERLLIPTGLHHILNETVRFTPIGGVATLNGENIVGALSIFNASLAHPGALSNDVVREATRFLAQGKIPFMMFGLPAAALAIYHTARPENKGKVKALLTAAALTCFTTGITEPLEFSFIFVSPVLFILHAFLCGVSFMLMNLAGVMIGNVQGGVIDLLVFGVLGGSDTRWWFVPLLGIVYFPLYYFSFRFIITRMNVKTPGREDTEDEAVQETIVKTVRDAAPVSTAAAKANTQIDRIIEGLGGAENIADVECCFTRLRVKIRDVAALDEAVLKTVGAKGIVKPSPEDIQLVFGPEVEKIAADVKQALAFG